MSDIVERLRSLAIAYPEASFPPPSPGEHGETVDQCSAAMGRHFSPIFTEAADEIERLRGEIANDVIFKALRERIEELEGEADELEGSIEGLLETIKIYKKRIEELEKEKQHDTD
jgi:chromosome segregation ATPase